MYPNVSSSRGLEVSRQDGRLQGDVSDTTSSVVESRQVSLGSQGLTPPPLPTPLSPPGPPQDLVPTRLRTNARTKDTERSFLTKNEKKTPVIFFPLLLIYCPTDTGPFGLYKR